MNEAGPPAERVGSQTWRVLSKYLRDSVTPSLTPTSRQSMIPEAVTFSVFLKSVSCSMPAPLPQFRRSAYSSIDGDL